MALIRLPPFWQGVVGNKKTLPTLQISPYIKLRTTTFLAIVKLEL